MNKRKYIVPQSKSMEMETEYIIATSGDAGGTIKPSPWGSNNRDSWYEEWEPICETAE